MSKLKLQNNKGEIATTLTVLSLFVMLAGVFVGGFNKPNIIQNRADAGSCFYNTTAIVMKARPGGGRTTFTQDENGGKVMSIKNDKQSQSFNLSSSNSSLVKNIPNYTFGGSNPYLPGDKATVTLSGLDEKWRVKEVFCIPQNSGAKGCEFNPSATGDKKLSIKDFNVVCGVDIQFGWVVELVPTITPTPTSLVVRPTSGTVQPIPTNSRLPILPTGSRFPAFPGDPTPTPVTDNEPPVSKTISGTVHLTGPIPAGAQSMNVSITSPETGVIAQKILSIPSTYGTTKDATLSYRVAVNVPASNKMTALLDYGFNGGNVETPIGASYRATTCTGGKTNSNNCVWEHLPIGTNLTASFNASFTPDQVGQPPVVKTKTVKGRISWTGNIPVGKQFRLNYNCTVGADNGFTCSEQKWITPDVKKTAVDYVITNANVGGDDNRIELALSGFANGSFPAGTAINAIGCPKQGRYPSDCLIENVNNITGDVTQDFQVSFPAAGQCNFASITQITDVRGNALPDFAQPALWSYANNKGGSEKFPNMFRSSYTSEKTLSASDDYVISDGQQGGVDYKRGDQLFWTLKYDPIQYRLLGNNIRVCDYNSDKDSVTGTNCIDNTQTTGNLLNTASATVDCNKKIIGGWWFEKLPPTPTPTPQAQFGDLEILTAVTENQSDVDTSSRQGVLNKINTPNSGFYQLRTTSNDKGDYTIIIKGLGKEFRSNSPTGGFRRFSHIPVGTYQIAYDLGSRGSSIELTSKTKPVTAGVLVEANKTTEATIVWKARDGIRLETETTCNACKQRGECGPLLGGSTVLCALKTDRGGANPGCWCTNKSYCEAQSDAKLGKAVWQNDKGYCDQSNGKAGDGLCCLGSGSKPSCEQRGLPAGCKDGEKGGGSGGSGGAGAGKCQNGDKGQDGQQCDNMNKCDHGGGCNADCGARGERRNGKVFDVPNGYCRSGFSARNEDQTSYQTCRNNACVYQVCPAGQTCVSDCSACGGTGGTPGGGSRTLPLPTGPVASVCDSRGGSCTGSHLCTSENNQTNLGKLDCKDSEKGPILSYTCCKAAENPQSNQCTNLAITSKNVREARCAATSCATGFINSGTRLGCPDSAPICCVKPVTIVVPPPAGDNTAACNAAGGGCTNRQDCITAKGDILTGKGCANSVCCKVAGVTPPPAKEELVTGPDCPKSGRQCSLDDSGGKQKCKLTLGSTVKQGYCCPDAKPNWDGTRCVATSSGRVGGGATSTPAPSSAPVPPPGGGDLSCVPPEAMIIINAALEDAYSKCNLIPNIDLGKITYSCDLHKESGPDNDHYKCDVHGEGAFDWNPGACMDAIRNVKVVIGANIYDPLCRAYVFASKAIAGCTNDGIGAIDTSFLELHNALYNKIKNEVLWGDVDVAVKDACLNPPVRKCSGASCVLAEYSTRYGACASTATALQQKLPNVWNAMKSAASSCGARFGGWSANIGIENGSDLPITKVTVSMCDKNGVCQDQVQDVSIQPGQNSNVQTSVTQMVSDQQLNDNYTLTCKLTYADGSTGDCPSSHTRLNTSVSMKVATDATGEVTGDALSSLEGSDCDGDNVVTTIDYTKMTLAYGQTGDAAQCDTDLSGSVNAIDAANVIRHLNEQVVIPDSSTTQQPTQ